MVTTDELSASARKQGTGFWLIAAALFLFMFASSAPSPLYVVYQDMWGFTAATLTAVFAVYVIALLAMLLTIGALSDYVGRKPVLVAAIIAEIGSMFLFVFASDVGWLYAARILQGLATGAATGAISAALIDMEPRSGIGSLINSAVPTAGLAMGALGAGILVQFAPAPTRLVYVLLLAAFVVTGAAALFLPEPVRRRPGALRSLRPQLGVPRAGRRMFLIVLPSLVVPWALGGLYLSLGRSVVVDILGVSAPLVGGLVVAMMMGTGSASSLMMRNARAEVAMTAGAVALAGGVTLLLVAFAVASLTLFLAGTVVSGFGFGVTFLGAFRTVTALAEPGGRAALVATLYVASYLTFSVPAMLAGFAATHTGLHPTAYGYGVFLIGLAVTALLARHLSRARS